METSLLSRAARVAARVIAALCLLGPLYVLIYLPASLRWPGLESWFYDKGWVALVLLGTIFSIRLMRRGRPSLALRRTVLLSPCFLAPLSLLYPWAAVPGKVGIAVGGPAYFYGWLSKYPTLGPVNGAILLGVLCLLGAGFVPCLFAFLWAGGGRRAWLVGLPVAGLVSWLPALVRLDVPLVLAGLDGAPGAWAGPVLRAAAAAVMCWLGTVALRSEDD